MAKSSEGGVWDQDLLESGRYVSTFVKRASRVAKANVVRDDWDEEEEEDDDDDEEQTRRIEEQKVHETPGGTKNDGTGPSRGPLGREGQVEARNEEDNNEIWEEANKRAPMPELIVAPASTSQSLPPPPPAALQPTLRILKRPSPNASSNNLGALSSIPHSSLPGSFSGSGSGSGGKPPAPRGTLAEREAQYQEARSRIFGEKEKSASPSGNASLTSMSGTSSSSGGIARDPVGLACEPDLDALAGQDSAHGSHPPKGFGERQRGRK